MNKVVVLKGVLKRNSTSRLPHCNMHFPVFWTLLIQPSFRPALPVMGSLVLSGIPADLLSYLLLHQKPGSHPRPPWSGNNKKSPWNIKGFLIQASSGAISPKTSLNLAWVGLRRARKGLGKQKYLFVLWAPLWHQPGVTACTAGKSWHWIHVD